MNLAFLSPWLHSMQVAITTLIILLLATVPISPLSAQEQRETKETNQMGILPNGTYLYGQSPQPNQMGQEYIVFKVTEDHLVGALYMPHSEFSCFQGTIKGNELAMTVDHPYEEIQYPYAIALEVRSSLASRDQQTQAPITLKGYHSLEKISLNDRRMLATCEQAFLQDSGKVRAKAINAQHFSLRGSAHWWK